MSWSRIGWVVLALSQTAVAQLHPLIDDECARKGYLSPLALQSASGDSFDVRYYKLNLVVTTSPQFLKGVVTVRATAAIPGLRTMTLDLVRPGAGGGMLVDSVLMNGAQVGFTQAPFSFTISLDRAYQAGELFACDIYYGGVPEPSDFGGFAFTSHMGVPWVWTLSEPYGAKTWWPCKDHPSDKADSVDVWVTCDAGYKVGSNGTLTEIQNNGDGTVTYKWAERYPIAAYLVSIALTNYVSFSNWFHYSPTDSMEVLNYVVPEHEQTARQQLPVTTQMLSIFSQLYGLYPFIREKYGHAEFNWGGAMEHQTMTSTTNFLEYTLAHELTHQWFGDMITCASWAELWLNEGFATYGEALYAEQVEGQAGYRGVMDFRFGSALQATGSLYVQDTTDVGNLFDVRRVYAKGAWVLHMLRHVIGDSMFFASLRAYVNDPRFRFGVATTDGFRSVCESVAGTSLKYFFDEWVFGEGYPRYRSYWTATPATGGSSLTITITQSTTSAQTPFFTMPVDIRISGGTRDTTIVVLNTFSGQQVTLALPFNPSGVVLDPDEWILRSPTQPSELPSGYSLSQNYPNPFNPVTTIDYGLPKRSHFRLTVSNTLGQEVAVLAEGTGEAGLHSAVWDGRSSRGIPMPSGVYYYTIVADDFSATKSMVLIK